MTQQGEEHQEHNDTLLTPQALADVGIYVSNMHSATNCDLLFKFKLIQFTGKANAVLSATLCYHKRSFSL